jgi:hypothetical protein
VKIVKTLTNLFFLQAPTKSQKEQLTERFQLKVTIGRREDWETAVREADEANKLTNETRVQEIEPKVQFYTTKLGMKLIDLVFLIFFFFSCSKRSTWSSSQNIHYESRRTI